MSTFGYTVLRTAILAAVLLLLAALRARAQAPEDEGPIEAWARVMAEATMPRWTGPRVEWAPPDPRPASEGALRSIDRPLAVHADPGVPIARIDRALAAIERAHEWLEERGWGTPIADGGRGGTDGFDLYLRGGEVIAPPGSFDRPRASDGELDEVPPRAVRIGYDAPLAWGALDAVTAFAEIDASVPDDALEACATSAYAQALLAELDPAEAPAWRRATGTWLAHEITGSLACAEDALEIAQEHPERGMLEHAPGSGEIGAALLAAISAHHDGGSGDFVRDLWHGARQWTWEGEGLRAEPDLWHAIEHLLGLSRSTMPRTVEEIAVMRWFAGGRGAGASVPLVRAIPFEIRAHASVEWSRLPRTAIEGEPELSSHGSGYVLADVRAAPSWSTLEVWLRGEFGVEWSMIAVRLDAEGRELGRVRAPIRREPRAYLPVELGEGTASVLIVVTSQGARGAIDADEPDPGVRGFRLVLARGRGAR